MSPERQSATALGAPPLLNVKTLDRQSFKASGPHNLRHLLPGHPTPGRANGARTHLNELVAGPATPEGIERLSALLMQQAGASLPTRHDAIAAFEVVFSTPAGMPNARPYLRECVSWLTQHTAAPCLSAVIHNDQAHPHCHAILLPLVAGRWLGSDLFKKADLARLHAEHRALAARYGLRTPERLTGKRKAEASRLVLAWMEASPARECVTWPEIRAAIEANPCPFLTRLGISIPGIAAPAKSLTAIMTGTGKKTSEDRKGSPSDSYRGSNEQLLHRIGVDVRDASNAPTPMEVDAQPTPLQPNPIGVASSPFLQAAEGAPAPGQPGTLAASQPVAAADDWRSHPPPHVQTPEQLNRWLRNRGERERRKRKAAANRPTAAGQVARSVTR